MSTRARANRQASGTATPSATSAKIHKRHDTDNTAMDVDEEDWKENVDIKPKNVNGRGAASKKPRGGAGKKIKSEQLESVDCTCSKGDDGSPMILCSMCKIWYHFTCVDVTEPQAEEISVYICPSCSQTTGRRSAMHWEGEQAVEECTDEDETTVMQRRKAVMKTRPAQQRNGHGDGKRGVAEVRLVEALKFGAEESDEMDDSEDDYVEENEGGRKKRQSRVRRLSTTTSTSDGDAGLTDDKVPKHRRIRRLRSPSHSPSVQGGKRKAKSASVGQGASPAPLAKRKKSTAGAVDEDLVRKYCLSKLEDMFKEVYLRYPYVRLKEEEEDGEGQDGVKIIKKELADMTEEEKEALVEDSRRFARELEACVYEIYAEPDKNGNPHAAAKYKDRFRTLQFNLSKPDRVVIHQRILSGSLSAKEISGMSSTDLADEETKQSIKLAEKEALEHSILQKQMVPRAKITHKGLQDIERGEVVNVQDFELEKERQEDEKRERERSARLKTTTPAATQANRQRTASMSVPPESPVVPPSAISFDGHQEQWGAPPPVPFRAMVDSPVEETTQEQRPSLFVQTSSDFMNAVPEPELNLDDIINMDEDQDASHAKVTAAEGPAAPLVDTTTIVASPTEMTSQTPLSTTGISPFAQRQDMPRAPSFDLGALWNEQPPQAPFAKDDQPKAATTEDKVPSGTSSVESKEDSDNMELESVEANDQDFDMFLAEDAEAEPQPPKPIPPPSVEDLPRVWTGKITMPLDSGVPQETTLVARQVGGKPLGADSPLWKTLFPSDLLRIEGRVPVENSVKYLVQMRLNPSKELYAVAFVPAGPRDENDFKAVNNFLISKSRHGLVFPWGNRPKDFHPGRELYMVPLLQTHTLPEFVELLDDLKLPNIRSKDYLIGVWILNKGKLTPPPGQSSHPPPVVQPSPAVLLNQQQQQQQQQPGSVPMSQLPPNPALASEVASLTPDQIQNILRTLVPLAPHPAQVTQQPPFSLHGPPPPGMPWIPQGAQPPPPPPPPFPFNFPPSNVPFQQQQHPLLHNSPNSPTRYDHQGSDRNEYDNRSGGYDHDYHRSAGPSQDHGDRHHRGGAASSGERGWRGPPSRGRGGGRGRGRGGDGQQERDFRAQRDSGWPRRPRNEGQDGPSW